MDTTLIPVRVGACLCPDTPHADGDFVYLRPKLGLAAGIALQALIVAASQDRPEAPELTGKLAEAYLRHGVAEWNLEGMDGPLVVTPEAIQEHLLSDFARSASAADVADDLYMGPVIAPLLARARESMASSSGTSNNGSTSATRTGSPKRPKRSKPSSTSTSPMDATGTTSTSPAGVSNS